MESTPLIRFPFAVIVALVLSSGLFWVLNHLVGGHLNPNDEVKAVRINFTRIPPSSPIVTKPQHEVQRHPPPVVPQVPKLSLQNNSMSNNVVMLSPSFNPNAQLSPMGLSVGSDQDVLPLVRIPPQYPMRAQEMGIQGWVIVQFDISKIGTVIHPVVVRSHPKYIFDRAALQAIRHWRYSPQIENGAPVERVGVRTMIRFELSK